jgi:arabinan endo-1,5-alpha-L-arabinosidase
MKILSLIIVPLLMYYSITAQPPVIPVGTMFTTNNTPVHDPVMIKEKDTYYLFCTGFGISVFSSKDMKNWRKESPVFSQPPSWAVEAIPTFKGHIWAPDISYYKGNYYLYYSVSAFGKNTSCIGVATNKTLDSSSSDFKWIDHGKVIQSFPGKTNWNAIDPNLATDEKAVPYLIFGSFWDGLKIVKLKKNRLEVDEDINQISTIASRKKDLSAKENLPAAANNPVDAGGNAIEAPFVFKKNNYYYLFASIDYCCKGVNSTYKMIVGRSKNIKGPYIDKDGVPLRTGGGTIVLQGDKNWYGVGHNAVCAFDGKDYIIFHGYDASDNGRSKLRIEELKWDNEWPAISAKDNTIPTR